MAQLRPIGFGSVVFSNLAWGYQAFSQTHQKVYKKIAFIGGCIWRWRASALWFGFLRNAQTPANMSTLVNILKMPHRPFFDYRLSSMERIGLVISHHQLAARLFCAELLEQLQSGRRYGVAQIAGKSGATYQLCIGQGPLKEGVLSLSLMADGKMAIYLAFTLVEASGRRKALIGCVQASANQPLETLRRLTHEFHGIQPRLLLIHALRMICKECEVQEIEAVSNENHAYMSPRYRRKITIQLAYDTLWEMVGGARRANRNFDIPLVASQKPLDLYPSRKRSEHRRRLSLRDDVRDQIVNNLDNQAQEAGSILVA